jgi:hypothetical protein
MALDETGVCEQCSRAAGKTDDTGHPSRKLNTPAISCNDRERLKAAYTEALQGKLEVETLLSAQIVSSDPNVRRRAKNELERAEKHAHRFLMELMAHNKKHGCQFVTVDKFPLITETLLRCFGQP